MPRGQIGFLGAVAGPLYAAFGRVFPGIGPVLEQIEMNKREWESLIKLS